MSGLPSPTPSPPSESSSSDDASARGARRTRWVLAAAYGVVWSLFLALNMGAPRILSRSTLVVPGDASGGAREISLNGLNFGVIAGLGMMFVTVMFAWLYVRSGRRGAG